MKKNTSQDRLCRFFNFALKDTTNLNHSQILALRKELLQIIDRDLLNYIDKLHTSPGNESANEDVDAGILETIKEFQKGIKKIKSTDVLTVKPYSWQLPEPQKRMRMIVSSYNHWTWDKINYCHSFEYLEKIDDIVAEAFFRLFREGIDLTKFQECSNCHNSYFSKRKNPKYLYCHACYKRCVDRDAKKEKRSTKEGKRKYNRYMNELRQKKKVLASTPGPA